MFQEDLTGTQDIVKQQSRATKGHVWLRDTRSGSQKWLGKEMESNAGTAGWAPTRVVFQLESPVVSTRHG